MTDGSIMGLLQKKMREAQDQMKEQLTAELFGEEREVVNRPLRKAIEDAWDTTTGGEPPKYKYDYGNVAMSGMDKLIKEQYMPDIEKNLFQETPMMRAWKKEREMGMDEANIALEAVRKRKEAKAADVVEAVGDFLENTDWEDGDTLRWTVEFYVTQGKTFHYVAVRGGNRWYITGDAGKWDTDSLTGHIATLALKGTLMFEDWEKPL
jgi:hypothetical protein